MAKQTKPKSKRTQVNDLNIAQQELTTGEATKVKGGILIGLLLPAVQKARVDEVKPPTTATTNIKA